MAKQQQQTNPVHDQDQDQAHESEVIDLAEIEAQLRPESSEKLRFLFYECYHAAARDIAKASVCVRLLKERGEPVNKIPLLGTFLRIASGQIDPEVLWKFLESPNRKLVERLPLDDQKRLVNDTVVVIAEPKPGGGFDKRKVDLVTAPATVAKLVMGPAGIRSLDEQMTILAAQKTVTAVKARAEEVAMASPADDIKEPLDRQIRIKVTASQLETLTVRAARSRCGIAELAYRWLVQSGVFKPVP